MDGYRGSIGSYVVTFLAGAGLATGVTLGVVMWRRGKQLEQGVLIDPGIHGVDVNQLVRLQAQEGRLFDSVVLAWRPVGWTEVPNKAPGDDVLWTPNWDDTILDVMLRVPGVLGIEQFSDGVSRGTWVLHTPGALPPGGAS